MSIKPQDKRFQDARFILGHIDWSQEVLLFVPSGQNLNSESFTAPINYQFYEYSRSPVTATLPMLSYRK